MKTIFYINMTISTEMDKHEANAIIANVLASAATRFEHHGMETPAFSVNGANEQPSPGMGLGIDKVNAALLQMLDSIGKSMPKREGWEGEGDEP